MVDAFSLQLIGLRHQAIAFIKEALDIQTPIVCNKHILIKKEGEYFISSKNTDWISHDLNSTPYTTDFLCFIADTAAKEVKVPDSLNLILETIKQEINHEHNTTLYCKEN